MTCPHHDKLIAQGWRFWKGDYANPHGYYCLNCDDIPQCGMNEGKCNFIVAKPYNHHFEFPHAPNIWSMELEISGQTKSGEYVWVKSSGHQKPPEEWGTIIRTLKAAWIAAEGIK